MSNHERLHGEFDPKNRMMEVSLRDGITESSIRRVGCLAARYLYSNPRIGKNERDEDEIWFQGTRTFVIFEIEGDKELSPETPTDPYEAKLRSFIKRVIPDAETPHAWLFAGVEDHPL